MVAARSPATIDPEMIVDTPPARQRRDIGSSTAAKDGEQKTWTKRRGQVAQDTIGLWETETPLVMSLAAATMQQENQGRDWL